MKKLVEYYVTDDAINIFVIGRNMPQKMATVRVPRSYNSLATLVKGFREALVKREGCRDLAAELYSILIQPLVSQSLISSGESLYIAPHRCLHYIPFQAIGVDSSLLLLTNPIAYLPVGSMIKHFSSNSREGTRCLVIKRSARSDGLTLQQSFQREAEQVASITSGDLITDQDTTPSYISKAIKGKNIVHFTCHGFFDQLKPLKSGLLLSDDQGNEWRWTVSDISVLPLQVDLVTLAACETGISERHTGDELVGIVRAVTSAGARSVISTLWPVHSLSTELLVMKFYELYLSGKTKVEALRLAQISLLNYTRPELVLALESELTSSKDGIPESEISLVRARLEELHYSETKIKGSLDQKENVVPAKVDYPYAHPYFWSAFILTGGWK